MTDEPHDPAPAETTAKLEAGEAVIPLKKLAAEVKEAGRPTPPPTVPAVISRKKSYDTVSLSATVYKNPVSKRSISVWHLQRRLAEWGHTGGLGERAGWYGDKTKNAVLAFQTALGLKATGIVDIETLERVFEGDTNVRISTT
jgi:peptidoglycan hydrolase-like protein with peptidoglycan-binding domain